MSSNQSHASRYLLTITVSMFFAYMTTGLAMPAIALFVHDALGLNNIYVGIAIGTQFVVTLLTRQYAGARSDTLGARSTTRFGMVCCAGSGLFYLFAYLCQSQVELAFALLIAGRIVLGFGESFLVTANLAWGIGLVEPNQSGKVMSWNGAAMYGSLAVSAPLGWWLYQYQGFALLSVVTMGLPLMARLINRVVPSVPIIAGKRAAYRTVLKQVLPLGVVLFLQGTGFAVLSAFVVLYFDRLGWHGGGFALSAFGLAFVSARIFLGNVVDKVSGIRVVILSLACETAGLLVLSFAPAFMVGILGAALTGLGCSLVFPALGKLVVDRVEAQSRATAIGAFSAFQDVAYGFTAPLTGIVANAMGYHAVFLICAICTALGVGLVLRLRAKSQHTASIVS